MITAELTKNAREKITKDYVRRLEDENAELLRKVVAAKEECGHGDAVIDDDGNCLICALEKACDLWDRLQVRLEEKR